MFCCNLGNKKTTTVAPKKKQKPTIAAPIMAGIQPRFFGVERGCFDFAGGDSIVGTNTPFELKWGMVTFFPQLTQGPD